MSKLRFLNWVINGLFILWLAACSQNVNQETTSPLIEATSTSVCLEGECIQEQATYEVVASPTATAAIMPCIADKQLYAQKPVGLAGTLVYRFIRDADTLYLIGGHPLRQYSLKVDDQLAFRLIGFSPSGKWLAYLTGSPYEGIPQTIHLLSSTGEVVQTTPTELVTTEAGTFKGSLGDILWINDETMLLYIYQPDPEYPDTFPLAIKALLNPFTGEWQQSYMEGLERKSTGTVAFAPDMTRVLFLSDIEGHSAEIRLQDVVQQQILWSQDADLETLFAWEKNWTGSAAWSPDSNYVAFTIVESRQEDNRPSGDGVYVLDREGVTGKIITDFYARYGLHFRAGALSWSPDGRYLAMAVSAASADSDDPSGSEDQFYLYDLKNDKLMDLCWFRGSSAGSQSTTMGLVWSPDSRYLVYVATPAVSEDGHDMPPALILVDIYKGEVIELVENAVELGGWSAHFTP